MKRCISCVIPESFPGVSFDSSGLCSICKNFRANKAFIPSIEKLRIKLDKISSANRSANSQYDALVAFSGGKDSTFLLHRLKEKYGFNLTYK